MSSRKKRQAEYNRRLILEAAARVLVTNGADGHTIEAIAKEADYSPAALYKYFKSKSAIFRELVQFVQDSLIEELKRPSVRPENLRGELLRILECTTRFATERAALFEALIVHGPRFDVELSGGLRRQAMEGDREFVDYLRTIMERGLAAGALKPGSAEDYAWAFRGLLQAFLTRWHFAAHAGTLTSIGAREHEMLLDLFLLGAGGTAAENPGDGS